MVIQQARLPRTHLTRKSLMNGLPPVKIVDLLAANADVFKATLASIPEPMVCWKPTPNDWCLLEIVCHLYDEEREDFRTRVKSTLTDPNQPWPPIDPPGWVTTRKYLEQNYSARVAQFLTERAESVRWLRGLQNPAWDNEYEHEVLGKFSAQSVLENWLAHDYLHLRQINRRRYGFLLEHSEDDLQYAGKW